MDEKTIIVKTKSEISDYLNTATKIEKNIYTLESACKELEEKARQVDYDAEKLKEDEISFNKREINWLQKDLAEKVKEKERRLILRTNYTAKDIAKGVDGHKNYSNVPSIIGVLSFFVFLIFAFVACSSGLADDDESLIYFGAVLTLGSIPLGALIGKLVSNNSNQHVADVVNKSNAREIDKHRRENEKMIKEYTEECNKKIEWCQKNIDENNAKIKKLNEQAKFYRSQIEQIRTSLKPFYENRNRFYLVGIVPPDYRTIDCVYVLDQIFRNDLADTMRDAILLYEERAFRGEVIRGMNNILRQLGNMSSLMSRLQRDLKKVSTDVEIMSNDVYMIYEQNRNSSEALSRSNEKIFEETKLNRYATEALKESNQTIAKYFEDELNT